MTVSLELLGRGPSRPDLLEDLVVDDATVGQTLGRWSVPAPTVVAPDRMTGQPALDEVAAVLAGGNPAVVDVAPGLAALTGGTSTGPATGVAPTTDTTAGGGERGGPAPEQSAAHLVDLLTVATHAGVGFGSGLVPRCADADQVWALLSGAVAAMTGGDVRAAVAAPDPARIAGLPRSAREAIRDVITAVLVPAGAVASVAEALAAAGGA